MRSSSSSLNNVLAIFILCFLTISLAVIAQVEAQYQQAPPARPKGAGSTPKAWLDTHNKERAKVGTPPLVWNQSLAHYAKNYVKTKIGPNCELKHSMGPYGENLASMHENIEGDDAVRFWCTEKADYDHYAHKCRLGEWDCGHYTQVVARKTKSVGCARHLCSNNWMIAICSYYPNGNIIGEIPF